jgi:(2Fe-2S) ferredoxin
MDTPARLRAYICCGPNCTRHNSPALIDSLQREVDQAGLGDEVEVMPGGCMKHCERGPSLAIWPGPVYYEEVDIARLRRIVREHMRGGRPIREWFYHEPAPRPPRHIRGRFPYVVPAPAAQHGPAHGKKHDSHGPRRPVRDVDDFKW